MKPVYGVLIFALVANAVANILIKEGMKEKLVSLGDPIGTIRAIALNPTLIVGVGCFGIALAAYSFVLSQVKLSVAYPIMTSAGFLIVITYSIFKLGESVTPLQMGGMACILAGVWMVASGL